MPKVFPIFDPVDADLSETGWWAGRRGYARRRIRSDGNSLTVVAHRVVLERKIGRSLVRGEVCDHINRNPLDNRRTNLRAVSQTINLHNYGPRKSSKTGVRGVYWDSSEQRWAAVIWFNYRRHRRRFKTVDAAASWLEGKRVELIGELHIPQSSFENHGGRAGRRDDSIAHGTTPIVPCDSTQPGTDVAPGMGLSNNALAGPVMGEPSTD